MTARVTAPRRVLHFCSKRRYFQRILRFCNLVGEIEEDLVESRVKAEETNKSWRIAQNNINRLEDYACSSTSGNESNGDRNIYKSTSIMHLRACIHLQRKEKGRRPFDDLRVWKHWVDNRNPAG